MTDTTASNDTVLSELNDDGVLTLTLNRPKRKNAFDNHQWVAFREAMKDAETNPKVACILITGAEGNFSSGVDLAAFSDGSTDGEEEHPFDSAAASLVDCTKPVVAAATGAAIGGGATLLLHCDVIYVGESLKMRFPFVQLGLVPEWGASYMLQAIVGARRAAEVMYTAEWIDADRAVELGIVTAKCADADLMQHAMTKAKEIAQWPVPSLSETKALLRRVHTKDAHAAMAAETEGMSKLVGSPENIEAVMAFMEKRAPDFKQFRK